MYKVIDKIDEVVPSFALFLILCTLIILLILMGSLLFFSQIPEIEANIIVVSEGLPVEGANLSIIALCMEDSDSEITAITDSTGNVLKGKTEIMLSELKSQITLASRADLQEKYLNAKTAISEGNYEDAQNLIIETMEELEKPTDLTPIIAIAVILIITGIIFWYFKIRNPQLPEDNEEN